VSGVVLDPIKTQMLQAVENLVRRGTRCVWDVSQLIPEKTMARPTSIFRFWFGVGFVALCRLPSGLTAQAPLPVVTRMFDVDSVDVTGVAISPDGRWVAYAQHTSERDARIFVRPAKGGVAIAITPAGHENSERPRFTPTGDRIIYQSSLPSRASDDGSYLMSVPFDSRTGQPTGPARQVSLEPVRVQPGLGPAISPDGKWIAYLQCCDAQRIRVIPTNGGNARTLTEHKDARVTIGNLAWDDAGTAVFYVVPQPGVSSWQVMRVPLAGGPPVVVRQSDAPAGVLAPGAHHGALVVPFGPNQRHRELRIRGENGKTVYRVRLPDGFDGRITSWSADGRTFIGAVRNQRSVIRLASTSGAQTRTVSAGSEYDWPDGWSADGQTLYYETVNAGAPVLGAVRVDGTQGGRVEVPKGGDYGNWGGVVGRYAIGVAGWIDSTRQIVTARNLDNGSTIQLTTSKYQPRAQMFIRGAGGTYSTDGDAYLYFERSGESIELHSVVPGQRHRVLRAFPATRAGRMTLAAHAGRVIYAEDARDSIRFMFAANASAPARVIASIPAGDGAGEIAWSKDGRHVAFGGTGSSIYVMELESDGSPLGLPKRYQLPFDYMYELSLLNDGRRLTMIAQPRGGPNAVVALVSLEDPSRPVFLNEADGTSTWGHMMSPDGQWTAYAAEVRAKGSTVFRVDLPAQKR
jgi:Tol biopolymer transport system component